jgi:hypothetical protein
VLCRVKCSVVRAVSSPLRSGALASTAKQHEHWVGC